MFAGDLIKQVNPYNMKKSNPSLAFARRDFLQTIAASTAALSLSSFIAPAASFHKYFQAEDPEAWTARIQGKHKMVFDATHPNGIYPFAWPRVFLMTNRATGSEEKDCCAVVVLRHSAIAYAFEHTVWEKYKFGEVFEAPDPKTNKPAVRNPFWKPVKGDFKVPGIGEIAIGINDLQESGVLFGVCSAAITVFSNAVSAKINKPAEEVKEDWMKSLLPEIQLVPSGVWALGRAQQKGCAYVFAG
jgi:intracellular sulfur oxidation DsrE/DsrF family protein